MPDQNANSSLFGEAEQIVLRAWNLQDIGQSDEAWQLIQPLLAASVPSPGLGLMVARVSRQFDHDPQALAYIEWLLTTAYMVPEHRAALHLAAAGILDRTGDFDRAFAHARIGKNANRTPYDHRDFTVWTDIQIDYFTADRLRHLPRASHGNRRPIFIIGMPRSGTSLTEQILACHPQVHAAGELQSLRRVRTALDGEPWTQGERFPACLDAMGLRHANRLAALYLDDIAALDRDATYVTDKMPTNFMLLGLVATLLPDCHVIHCRRDPLDACLSCYMTAFEPGLPFTHDLDDLACFFRDYHRLMDHWNATIGFPMIEVDYEQLVGDLEGETRRVLAELNLSWDERCRNFHRNMRKVGTASSDQVRRPLYASSIGRWKHYERHLAALAALPREMPGQTARPDSP